jgi:hypothetical protein
MASGMDDGGKGSSKGDEKKKKPAEATRKESPSSPSAI